MARLAKATTLAVVSGAMILTGAGGAVADAGAQGAAIGSPGVLSGNVVQAPIHIPVNVCGNTVNVVALLNPSFGNVCVNKGGHHGDHHGKHHAKQQKHHKSKQQAKQSKQAKSAKQQSKHR